MIVKYHDKEYILDDKEYIEFSQQKTIQDKAKFLLDEFNTLQKKAKTQFNLLGGNPKDILKDIKKLEQYSRTLYNFFLNIEDRQRRAKEKAQKEIRETFLRTSEKEADAKIIRAGKFLNERGLVFGKDFDHTNAIDKANQHRFEELQEAFAYDGGPYSFNGQNCDDCRGWDGASHRCDCGNRRVECLYGGDFENMYLYGEAY